MVSSARDVRFALAFSKSCLLPSHFPQQSKQVVTSHVDSWDIQGTLTKLHIFQVDVYDTILYLDANCLVVKDGSHLLDLGKVYIESKALIAAAPDNFPPDKFNAGEMVVCPSQSVFDNMMVQTSRLTSYDGGDTGFTSSLIATFSGSTTSKCLTMCSAFSWCTKRIQKLVFV
jgi:hypothetical protein